MKRHTLGAAGLLLTGIAIALPATAPTPMSAKQAALQGKAAPARVVREQNVGTLIVKLRESSTVDVARAMSASRVRALSATAGVKLTVLRSMAGGASLLALQTPLRISEAQAIVARLSQDPAIEYAEPDIILKKALTPNDTRAFSPPSANAWQWNLLPPGASYTGEVGASGSGNFKTAPAAGGANLQAAWDLTTGSNTVTVAIVDTGIVNHSDLNGSVLMPPNPAFAQYVPNARFLPGYDFVSSGVGAASGLPANFVSNDGDGPDPDPSDPGDWVTTQEESMYGDICDDGQTGAQNSSWHGSHMSGVAGALTNNNFGIAGIGWLVRILPVRALGKCGGSLSDIATAIRWAAGDNVGGGIPVNSTVASVINLSLGGGSTCPVTMQQAIDFARSRNVVVVAATGNDGQVGTSTPANCNGVIGVTAHTINGDNADYSNVGPGTTISAPGGGSPTLLGVGGPTDDPNWRGDYIASTVLFANTDPLSANSAGSTGPAFGFFTGTSAATPHVAGTVALIKSRVNNDPNATPDIIKAWITMRGSITPHPGGGACIGAIFDCGKGLLNVRLALDAADNRLPGVSTPTFIVAAPNAVVNLAGSATAFFPASISSRRWSQISGATVTLNNATTNNASFTAPATNNILVFDFSATDNLGKTGVDRVVVRTNTPPTITNNPPAQAVTVGQTVSFTVTATDPDGTTPTFTATTSPSGSSLASSGQFMWDTTSVSPGSYALTYVANDPFSSSSPATVSIAVNAVAPPPSGGTPPPTGGGGGGGSLPFWQLMLLGALTLASRVRARVA